MALKKKINKSQTNTAKSKSSRNATKTTTTKNKSNSTLSAGEKNLIRNRENLRAINKYNVGKEFQRTGPGRDFERERKKDILAMKKKAK
jgi:hypothetical protein